MKTIFLIFGLSAAILVSGCTSAEKKASSQPQDKSAAETKQDNKSDTPPSPPLISMSEKTDINNLIRAQYVSEDGRSIVVIYDNVSHTATIATGNGTTVYTLSLATSGSGSRYTNDDESIVFWIKGDTGTLWIDEKIAYSGKATNVTQMNL